MMDEDLGLILQTYLMIAWWVLPFALFSDLSWGELWHGLSVLWGVYSLVAVPSMLAMLVRKLLP